MSKQLLILGASGHGKVVLEAASLSSWDVLGFADDDAKKLGQELCGHRVICCGLKERVQLARDSGASIVVAVGHNETRRQLYEELCKEGVPVATVIHPAATIAASATIGPGSVVFAGVVVNADTRVGKNVILNTGVTVDHDNVIGDHVHISPGAHLGGTVLVGDETHIGIGATVSNNLSIGARTIVGAGAVVVRDIPADVLAFGCPAKVIRSSQP